MFCLDGCRRPPHRVSGLVDNLRGAQRRVPVQPANADWVGDHRPRLAFLRWRIIIQPEFGQIEHQAISWRIGQDSPVGQVDRGAITRQPAIDAGIDQQDFILADIEAPGDIQQGVVLFRVSGQNAAVEFTDQAVIGVFRQRVGGRQYGSRKSQCQAEQGEDALQIDQVSFSPPNNSSRRGRKLASSRDMMENSTSNCSARSSVSISASWS